MVDIWIIGMWIVTFALMGGFVYAIGSVGFYLFALAFCTVDNYMQDRYWRKRGYTKAKAQDGQEWYVGYEK